MALSVAGKRSKISFYDWRYKEDNISTLVGEEKYLYELDENDNVINLELVTLDMIKEPFDIQIKDKLKNTDSFYSELEIYTKILNFIKKHKINKDIDLDKWTWDEINKFIIWIRAIDDEIPIKVENFETSVM